MMKAKPEFGQSVLWWDSFDETAEFSEGQHQPDVSFPEESIRSEKTVWGNLLFYSPWSVA
jgi:hypothetical protein